MSTVETGSGFITGVDPRNEPPTAQTVRDAQAHQTAQPPVQIVMNQPPAQETAQGRFYSEEQVNAMRAETDARLTQMSEQLQQLTTERETREAAIAQQQAEAEAATRAAEEEKMDVRQLLDKRESEWQQRWDAMEKQREMDQAIFEKERAFQQLQEYRRDRIAQEDPYLMPQFRDLIQGSTVEEIEAAIEDMKRRTQATIEDFQNAYAEVRPPVRGASLTGQPSMGGPLEQGNVEQLSVEDLRKMDNQTYGRYRDRLMQYTRRG